jgi:type IV secretion system protein VirD4
MLLRKTPYWERPELAGMFAGNPYRGGTPGAPWWTPLGICWGRAVL